MRGVLLLGAAAAALASNAPDFELIRNPLPSDFCDPTAQGESGYLKVSDSNGNKAYFYQAWTSRGNPATDPVALWLTGGPGCSSQLALYMENGPCQVNADGSGTVYNPYSWNANASMIWLDQPAGAGFSTGDTDTTAGQTSEDIWYFLQAYFAAHPEQVANEFYITGESYGGASRPVPVPAVRHCILPGASSLCFRGLLSLAPSLLLLQGTTSPPRPPISLTTTTTCSPARSRSTWLASQSATA